MQSDVAGYDAPSYSYLKWPLVAKANRFVRIATIRGARRIKIGNILQRLATFGSLLEKVGCAAAGALASVEDLDAKLVKLGGPASFRKALLALEEVN